MACLTLPACIYSRSWTAAWKHGCGLIDFEHYNQLGSAACKLKHLVQ